MKRNALLIVAAAFFLLVVGWNAYSIVCLPEHWEVNCYVSVLGGKVLKSNNPYLTSQLQADAFVARAEQRGETCYVGYARRYCRIP